ncbi:MAG: hypothetical protein ABI091_26765 [Ferruginibacter sp.]
MAANGQKLIYLDGLQLDVAPQFMKDTQARYVKNLWSQLTDLGEAGTSNGAQAGVLKPLPSNEIYCPLQLPSGDNHAIGSFPSTETKELYVLVFNSFNNHTIFRIDGINSTCEIVKIDPCFNFKLDPKYFIGEGQIWLEVVYLINPDTTEPISKKDLYWTDGYNYQGYLRVEDSIATNGFDPINYPYFAGTYDKCSLVRMGLPTPDDCIKLNQVPFNTETDIGKNNNEKFSTWQFRILDIDVFGRPSEHGIISDLYYISNNSCLSASDQLSRCVALTFPAGNPIIDKKQIEYRNCNDEQWYIDSVIDLYQGSNIGEWWRRIRNPNLTYNATTNEITYNFCKDKLCDPIDPTETNRTAPGLARTSQALTKIGKSIALANNKDGFPPFSKVNVLDKISMEVIKPVASTIGHTANIVVWIRIYNPITSGFQKVWKKDNDYVFGGISNGTGITNIKSDYQQYFAVTDQKGPIGYLAGTNNFAIGKQYYLDTTNTFIEDTDFNSNYDKPYFLKFEFTGVPKQVYPFRLASHLADPNVSDITKTSTYIGGVWKFSNFNVGSKISENKEIIIDVCNSDYDTLTSGEMLLMNDLTNPRFYGNRLNPFFSQGHFSDSSVADGYVNTGINTATGLPEKPVELLNLFIASTGSPNASSVITDHNGFYFASSVRPSAPGKPGLFKINMIGYCNCIKKSLVHATVGTNYRRYIINMNIGQQSIAPVASDCPDFDIYPCSYISVKGKVQLCNGGTGVPNLNVVLARGGIATTDSNGEFTIIAHDDVLNGFRKDSIYIMGGGCAFTACDGGCIEIGEVLINPCNSCGERIVDTGTYEVLFISNRGLLTGGNYIAEITGHDWLGREGFAQTGDNFKVDIPTLNSIQGFGFSTVNMIIPPTVTFDSWVDYVTIGITAELNYAGNYIEWIADKVTFVDNSGNENKAAPTQIRIDYSSLNEYNAKNNFNTTTGWAITPEGTTSPRTADLVQFIRNGDGTFFSSPITALVKYDQTGQYFLINYTDNLKDLKENALIRLANPNECANKDVFFELCGKYKVINGKIQQNKITLNAFDTYYQYRQIPVPVTTGTPPDTTTVIELRQFGFPFESPSVTDFWGDHSSNKGKINVKNSYENEILHLNQIALSGAATENGQLNYLNYFEDSNAVDFNINNTGGILYVRIKTGMAFILCQFKNFVVGFQDNIARLNAQNIITVPSGINAFGLPERATTGDYGCQLFDKSTIRERLGLVHWLDRNKVSVLQNDFQETVDVSRYNPKNSTILSWLMPKIKYQQQYNVDNGNVRYFHAVINPANFEYILSEFTIGGNNYVNVERDIDVTQQETISLDILAKVWKTFYSFTPEYFGFLDGANSGQLLFSFKNGIPYSHSVINQTSFNTFFGVQCERIYRFIYCHEPANKNKNQSISVYCTADDMYWSDLIITDNRQVSRLLKEWWEKHLYFWSANFLCNSTSTTDNGILENDNLEGNWIDIRLVGDANGEYSELTGIAIFEQEQSKTGT